MMSAMKEVHHIHRTNRFKGGNNYYTIDKIVSLLRIRKVINDHNHNNLD